MHALRACRCPARGTVSRIQSCEKGRKAHCPSSMDRKVQGDEEQGIRGGVSAHLQQRNYKAVTLRRNRAGVPLQVKRFSPPPQFGMADGAQSRKLQSIDIQTCSSLLPLNPLNWQRLCTTKQSRYSSTNDG